MANLQGVCSGCNMGIPHGYLAVVTSWTSKDLNGLPVQVPVSITCRPCSNLNRTAPVARKSRVVINTEKMSGNSLIDMVTALLSSDRLRGARTLSNVIGTDLTNVRKALRSLVCAGRVVREEGRFKLA